METKYYIPEISEFFVGFEYERMNGDKWENSEFSENDCYGTLAEGYENEFEEINKGIRTVRVKYLDEEDIKSLGFIPGLTWVKQHERYDKGEYCIQLIGDGKITIYEYMGKVLFHGKIKNVSELKKVLQMLDIK